MREGGSEEIVDEDLEKRILTIGTQLIASAKKKAKQKSPEARVRQALFEKCMDDPHTKEGFFGFVEVLPALKTKEQIAQHLTEYIDENVDLGTLGKTITLARKMPTVGIPAVRTFAERTARTFIGGKDISEVQKLAEKLAKQGYSFTFDVLGEKTLSEQDANRYQQQVIATLDGLADVFDTHAKDISGKPLINVSLKLSALTPHFDPLAPAATAEDVKHRLRPIYRRAQELGAFINLDKEHYQLRDITNKIFQDILLEPEFHSFADVGMVIQAYLEDSEIEVNETITWARERKTPISIRLVKGAYWDYEVSLAQRNGWQIPVFTDINATNRQYEKLTDLLLQNSDVIRPCIASQNVRSIVHALALQEKYNIDNNLFEIQTLYGMADEITDSLVELEKPTRVYIPYGELIPGMAYFVRRLLENSSNVSALRTFDKHAEPSQILQVPYHPTAIVEKPKKRFWNFFKRKKDKPKDSQQYLQQSKSDKVPPNNFRNTPVAEFHKAETRDAMQQALTSLEQKFGMKNYTLRIGKESIDTGQYISSVNPSERSQVIGRVAKATTRELEQALEEAHKTFAPWHRTPAEERAAHLFAMARQMEKEQYDLAALVCYESGKIWREAHADVAEAIDFLNLYGEEMCKLDKETITQATLGERNTIKYIPRGVVSVIAPWNFPLAILTGMTSAAIVTGNTAVIKPSPETPLIAGELMRIAVEAKLPPGVINYVVCDDQDAGILVDSPLVSMVAFTGSKEVGLKINKQIADVKTGQHHVKKAIAEMGGKNAIIVDASADLEEAVLGVISSALGHQGQKCSASSRVIVDARIYDAFLEKAVAYAKTLRLGDARDPATDIGPLINQKAYNKVCSYIQLAEQQGGRIILPGKQMTTPGFYVAPTIIETAPENPAAQEEIFGPVLVVLKAQDFSEAISLLNGTPYGLTGGLYSRTPSHIRRFKEEALVGNQYINRGITGAIVERQPFGGFKLSGSGSKSGCKEYLTEFMYQVSCSENRQRSGYIPGIEQFARDNSLTQ